MNEIACSADASRLADNHGTKTRRTWSRRAAWGLLFRRTKPLDDATFRRSAIIFSPHYDDETLGCGGTIIRRRDAGAAVTIVFMTDGSQSHKYWMPTAELSKRRSSEGREAAAALGVGPDDVIEMHFPETALAQQCEHAVQAVATFLKERRPDDVFVPYYREPPADHRATTNIVLAALKETDASPTVYEYPIWAWHRWPWVNCRGPFRRGLRVWYRDCIKYNRLFLNDMHVRADIGPLISRKQAALARHRTQTIRMNDDPTWPILSDVADGGFLPCFFENVEFFGRRTSRQNGRGAST